MQTLSLIDLYIEKSMITNTIINMVLKNQFPKSRTIEPKIPDSFLLTDNNNISNTKK